MAINLEGVNNYSTYGVAGQTASVIEEAEKAAEEKKDAVSDRKEDKFVKQPDYVPSKDQIAEIRASMKNNMSAFEAMVKNTFSTQSGKSAQASLMQQLLNAGVTPEQAAQNISEDGFWGVEATANRLVDFAKGLAGNDPAKADELLAAIEKGFEAAGVAWGEKLPDISYQTLNRVYELFDEWKNGTGDNADPTVTSQAAISG